MSFEERVTIWATDEESVAVKQALAEASEYVDTHGSVVGLVGCHKLNGPITDSSVVFRSVQESELDTNEFIDFVYDTGVEFQENAEPPNPLTNPEKQEASWFAVRSLHRRGAAYRETISLHLARNENEAFDQCEHSSKDLEPSWVHLSFWQSFRLFEDPKDGSEVFSLIRDSSLSANDYLNRHFPGT
jgi:hypothetical protein